MPGWRGGPRLKARHKLRHSCHRFHSAMRHGPRCRLESPAEFRLSMGIRLHMVNGMGIRGAAGKRAIAMAALGVGRAAVGLHAADHRAGVRGELHAARQEAARQPALRQGHHPGAVSPPHRRLSPQGSARAPSWSIRMRAISITCSISGKAIRYGVTVGEEALVFSGVAKVGRKEEWPSWTPTADIKKRLTGIPDFVGPGPHNPLGSRGLYLSAATRTRCTASTAPTSRNISARRSPRAASA